MNKEKKGRFVRVTKWNQYHDWPPIGGLRHLIEHAEEKKCTNVFIKASGRWLVDEEAFFIWVDSYRRRSHEK